MSTKEFYIIYDGPALNNNEIDVRDLAPALLAFSDLFQEANTILNGSKANVTVNVKGTFKTGSFGIDFSVVQDIKSFIFGILNTQEVICAATIATLLGFNVRSAFTGVIQALRALKGKKAEKLVKIDGKNRLYISGENFIELEDNVIKLLESPKIRDAFQKIIYAPLKKEGITTFGYTEKEELIKDDGSIELINNEEIESFITPQITSQQFEIMESVETLQIVSISFQENNKWRFNDGSSTFFSDILDNDFLNAVNSGGISFRNGDLLKVKLQIKKHIEPNGMIKSEKTVIKVIDHIVTAMQLSLIDNNSVKGEENEL